jgi:WD40 repeat protein
MRLGWPEKIFMLRYGAILASFLVSTPFLPAQAPSYSKDIRPILAKYCLECHNAKTLKGGLNLETHKVLMEGSDGGPVVVTGEPDKSLIVLLTEHKEKPTMPPPKAKFQPTKAEVALLRAWVKAGAADDAANIKVELQVIKPKADVLPPVTALAYSRRWETLIFTRNNRTFLVDFGRGIVESKELPRLKGRRITALAHVGNSSIVLAGVSEFGQTGEIMTIFTDENYRPVWIHADPTHVDAISDVAAGSKLNGWMASSSYDSTIFLGDGGRKSHVLKEHSDAVYGLAFNPDGAMLASVSADRAMKVFDVEKCKLLYTLGEATDWLYTVAWSPDGKYLVSGGVDKSIRVYEPTHSGAKLRQSVFAHEGAVQKLVFTSDSKTLYSVGEDRVVKAWDIEKMVERKVYDKQPETVLCLALREDAGQFIVGRYDGIVQLIDMKTGKVAHEFGGKKEGEKGRKGETENKEPPVESGQRGAAQKTTLPADLTATLDRAGAVQVHRFDAGKNQPLGIRVTKEAKSKIDPVLVLTDGAGRTLTESYDGHLGYIFSAAGTYAISVRDRDYRGGPDFKYRLELGAIPVISSIFPLGLQRGTTGKIRADGVFLPHNEITINVPQDAIVGSKIPLNIATRSQAILGKQDIVVGEYPEVLAPEKKLVPIPGTANGRLTRDGQKDVWSFHARKGNRLIVEVNARRLGSRLDSIIEILDKNDQPVPRAVLRSQAKTHVTFRDHDSVGAGIRIEAWSELATNDFLFVGNELMKIQSLPTHPDADCIFFATEGKRLGYLDTTPTHHANNTPMYKVSLHPPGTTFPPNGFPVFTLYYRNDDGGPGYGRDSRILFDPPADGEYKVRIADARGLGGANFGYRLTIRHPRESFTLRATPASPVVSKGGAVPITLTAQRIDGFDGPIKVQVKNLPPGFHMPPTTIEAGTYKTTVALFADADANAPDKSPRLILEGTAYASDIPLSHLGNIDVPKLTEPGDIVTTTAESEVSIKPGEQAKMLVKIERRNGFKGRVPLDVRGLPHGVRVLDIGLNGILVNENEAARTVVLYAEPWVQAADHPFVVLARREGKNTEHAAKSVMLKVK